MVTQPWWVIYNLDFALIVGGQTEFAKIILALRLKWLKKTNRPPIDSGVRGRSRMLWSNDKRYIEWHTAPLPNKTGNGTIMCTVIDLFMACVQNKDDIKQTREKWMTNYTFCFVVCLCFVLKSALLLPPVSHQKGTCWKWVLFHMWGGVFRTTGTVSSFFTYALHLNEICLFNAWPSRPQS